LEISFATKDVRELCEKRKIAEKQLGDLAARQLRARLTEICICENLSDMPFPPEADAGKLFYRLSKIFKLMFEPLSAQAKPTKVHEKTTRLKILSIEN